MADVVLQQPIRSVYKDGSIVVSNVKSKIDNSTTSYSVVNVWYDGTPMDDSKVDQFGVYSKYKPTGEYLRENKLQWGELFLEVDTVAELRAMSPYNQFLILIGYYKGVRLGGYYVKGDTPAPIDYFITLSQESDNNGSVIDVGIIKLKFALKESISSLYFGIKEHFTDNLNNFQNYYNNNDFVRTVYISSNISLPLGVSLEINRSDLVFEVGNNVVYKEMDDNVSLIIVNGSWVTVRKAFVRANFYTTSVPLIRHNFGSKFQAEDCNIYDGIRGYQCFAKNPLDETPVDVFGVTFTRCKMFNLRDGIYLGENTSTNNNGNIYDIKIDSASLYDGKGDSEETGGDGIKATKKCYNITVINTYIDGFGRDAIDLFASGNKVLILGVHLKNCRVKGLDIKSDRDKYSQDIWGKDGVDINVSSSFIEGNLIGVAISRDASLSSSFNHSINFSNVNFIENKRQAITLTAKYVNIHQCLFRENGKEAVGSFYSVIELGDNTSVRNASNCTISGNTFLNNGKDGLNNYAVRVGAFCIGNLLYGNQVHNDTDIPNSVQTHGFYFNNQSTTSLGINKISVANPYTIVAGANIDKVVSISKNIDIKTPSSFTFIRSMGNCWINKVRIAANENVHLNLTSYFRVNLVRRRINEPDLTIASYSQSENSLSIATPLELSLISNVGRFINFGDILLARVFHTDVPGNKQDVTLEIEILEI